LGKPSGPRKAGEKGALMLKNTPDRKTASDPPTNRSIKRHEFESLTNFYGQNVREGKGKRPLKGCFDHVETKTKVARGGEHRTEAVVQGKKLKKKY